MGTRMIRRGRSFLARLAGFLIGVAIASVILAIQLPPARALWLTIAVVAAVAGIALVPAALRAARAESGGDERIRGDGLLGRATVLAAVPTGRRRGDRDELELELEVTLPGRRRFIVTRRDWLDPAQRARVVVGRPVSIAADPAEPGHVVLALENDDVNPAAIAGLGPFAGGRGGPLPSRAARDQVSAEAVEPEDAR